ncbi:hypothetical protein H1R20_g4216, partial [Candolleomyces eurysporus]
MSSLPEIVDLVGLGFGPANIAIAGAVTEAWKENPSFPVKTTLFIERHEIFRWHPGMLLPGARMQISFMKDLATLRNPGSPYTFLSYLHSEDRLLSFINRGSTIPTRKEYSDYLSWASAKVQENGINVAFGHEVVDLEEGPEDTILEPDESSSAYATSISPIFQALSSQSRPLKVAVIGSDIATPGGRHVVDMLIRKGSLKPSDDSPFANEIFDPASTDAWYSLPSKRLRDNVLAEYKQTNYSVVNPLTIETLYEIVYDQRLNTAIARRTEQEEPQDPVINIRTYTKVASIRLTDSKTNAGQPADLLLAPEGSRTDSESQVFHLTLSNMVTADITEEKYDVVVYATGYERSAWVNFLKHTAIGKHFGLSPATRKVNLRPTTDLTDEASGYNTPDSPLSESRSPVSSSANTSPPTSPEASMFNSVQFEAELNNELYLTRSYQLLPKSTPRDGGKSLVPRIYLQGVEEATHGLSDTLLSVLGIRSGEVLADLSKRPVA